MPSLCRWGICVMTWLHHVDHRMVSRGCVWSAESSPEDFLVIVAFSLRARIQGECLTIHSLHALFFPFFFPKVEMSSHMLIPLFRPGSVQSGSVSWDDCDRVFPDGLRVRSFPERFPHPAWTAAQSAHSNFDVSRVYACLGVTCHLHFWQNDRGFSCTTAVTRG